MKKIIGVFLLLGMFLIPVSASFSDVSETHLYKDAINYVQEQGIVNGYSDGTFKPGNLITRGEFTKIIIQATQNEDDINKCMQNYTDGIGVGTTYYKDIFSDLESGTTNTGYTFTNLEDIYKQFTKDQVEGVMNSSNDTITPTIRVGGNKFVKYICVAKYRNIISGYSDGTFKLDNNITVEEASKIIVNAFELNKNFYYGQSLDKFAEYLYLLSDKKALPEEITGRNINLTRGQMAEIVYRVKENISNKPSKTYDESSYELI